MTGEKFAEIVTKRAHERVEAKLRTFKHGLHNLFSQLTGDTFITKDSKGARGANYAILAQMVEKECIDFGEGWPALLWVREEEKVADELLSMMDEMQKALLAPDPKDGDCIPETTQKEERSKPNE